MPSNTTFESNEEKNICSREINRLWKPSTAKTYTLLARYRKDTERYRKIPNSEVLGLKWAEMVKWNGPFRSDRSNREKRSTSKGGPLFSKLFPLDLTDPFSFRPKFPEILVEWIAPRLSVKPWTPEKISGMFIVSRPIRCEMKPQN